MVCWSAYSQIKVAYNAPDDIFYQCTAHGLMGHKFKVVSKRYLIVQMMLALMYCLLNLK